MMAATLQTKASDTNEAVEKVWFKAFNTANVKEDLESLLALIP